MVRKKHGATGDRRGERAQISRERRHSRAAHLNGPKVLKNFEKTVGMNRICPMRAHASVKRVKIFLSLRE
jgi:hypothetical protein